MTLPAADSIECRGLEEGNERTTGPNWHGEDCKPELASRWAHPAGGVACDCVRGQFDHQYRISSLALDQYSWGEANVIYTIQDAMRGGVLYPHPEHPPFAITQYSPLYYIAVAEMANLLRLVPGEQVSQVYQAGRGLSVLMALLISGVVFVTC